jgi:hypothetical protein
MPDADRKKPEERRRATRLSECGPNAWNINKLDWTLRKHDG